MYFSTLSTKTLRCDIKRMILISFNDGPGATLMMMFHGQHQHADQIVRIKIVLVQNLYFTKQCVSQESYCHRLIILPN